MKKIICLIMSFIFIFSFAACSCNKEDTRILDAKNISVSMVQAYLNKEMSGKSTLVYPFNTTISLTYFKDEDIEKVEDYFKTEYSRLHKLFDRHYYYFDDDGNLINNLRVINESNGEVVVVDKDLIDIIKEGIKSTKLSKGKFNIGVGNLSGLWDGFISAGSVKGAVDLTNKTRYLYQNGEYIEDSNGNYILGYGIYVNIDNYARCDYDEESNICSENEEGNYIYIDGSSPSEEQITESMKCIPSYENIEEVIVVDEVNNTIKINSIEGCNSSLNITLGALAKSYAAEKITSDERFKNGDYLLNAGQSTIKVIGKNMSRENREWNVGITDSYLVYKNEYDRYASYLMKLNESMSVSTSSGDENHYYYKNNYYHHIIDPLTGYPNQNRFAITATCKNAMYADIITTSLMSMNMNETTEFLKILKNSGIDVDVIIQDKHSDGVKVLATNKMKNRISIRYNNEKYSDYLNSIVIEEFSYDS